MKRLLIASAMLSAMCASAVADEHGVLNPVEGGVGYLKEHLSARPDRAGFLCWVAYETQKGGTHDVTLEALNACADAGNEPSMIMLSHIYENGLGTEADPERATYWVRQAAERGYATGQYHYGMALLRGYGVAEDREEAVVWLRRAAEGGDTAAADALRSM